MVLEGEIQDQGIDIQCLVRVLLCPYMMIESSNRDPSCSYSRSMMIGLQFREAHAGVVNELVHK